ncbi:hypothetical protein AAFF_G00049530 [Aldrovandia affinis]|uniref:Uncharacterized protein n=1 Tax=Aldrovandia affinis TaxID=143900 RepID=A0AAD7S1E3_9TELE|nr:hypothetical protein AAFF_G00049530 [Aldrovandia affinis]
MSVGYKDVPFAARGKTKAENGGPHGGRRGPPFPRLREEPLSEWALFGKVPGQAWNAAHLPGSVARSLSRRPTSQSRSCQRANEVRSSVAPGSPRSAEQGEPLVSIRAQRQLMSRKKEQQRKPPRLGSSGPRAALVNARGERSLKIRR